jgi:fatty-acyl-CoA synthase
MVEAHLAPRGANYQPLTPVTFLWRTADCHPGRTAVIDDGRQMTWREFADFVRRFAGALARRGVGKGDVVSIVAPNCLEMLASHYAVPAIGAVLNTINTRLDAETIAYITAHSESRLLIADAAFREIVNAATRRNAAVCPIVWLGTSAGEAAADTESSFVSFLAESQLISRHSISDEWQPICLNYTSGTTGRPKGVVYHHRGAFLNSLGNALALGFSEHTRYLWVLPMFHCNGWAHTWAITAAGGTHVCLNRVDPAQILRKLVELRITHMSCAPVVLYMLTAEPGFRDLQLAGPLTVATGGASPTPKLLADLEAVGVRLVHLYGLTESYGPATFCAPEPEWDSYTRDVRTTMLARQGVPHPTAGDALVLDGTGAEVPADGATMGEIVLRGNTLMAGYYKDSKATEEAFAGSVFHTGDLGVRHPEGHIQIRDRAKDVIIAGGENISPLEIENVLHQHPAVFLAAVVAMPDDKWGELPCAFVELRPDAPVPSEAELIQHCRQQLARFKVPRKIVVGELPRTATGKIQKYLLREQLRAPGKASGA